MALRSLDQLDLAGRRVFVRADLDVPLRDGVILDDARIRAALPTLRKILGAGGSAVVASHLWRRREDPGPELSLEPVAIRLRELLAVAVDLAPQAVGREVAERAARLPRCAILLLENLRFHSGERANDPDFGRQLASLAQAYVNDAFAVCHRSLASVVRVPTHFAGRDRAVGELLHGELRAFERILGAPEPPLVVVIGGTGVREKLDAVRNLLPKADALLLGGAVAHAFLHAQGVPTGDAPVEPEEVEAARELLAEAEAQSTRVLLPVDHVIARRAEAGAPTRTTEDAAVPEGWQALDIGPQTLAACAAALAEARTALWTGPLGVVELDDFARGTFGLVEALAGCPGFTVVTGEDSTSVVHRSGFAHRIDHISTGGGASLALLRGKILPGLAAIEG